VEILHFVKGSPPRRLSALEGMPDEGVLWVDVLRSRQPNWECTVEPVFGVALEPQHVTDSMSSSHPSFFDGTSDYDMLIFEGLGPRDEPLPLETRSASFFIFPRALVTVHAEDGLSFSIVKQRIAEGRLKTVASPLHLAQIILDTMVDRFLKIRDPLDQRFTAMQDELLDAKSMDTDWHELLIGRREARKLEALSESQAEALDAWRRNTTLEWSQHDDVRFRDLTEHVNRVLTHASGQERDLEAAVQLHFAAMSHRTNRVVQTLTVLSAIFFPMTLITGIYGMNFENMPELHTESGYYVVLGVIAAIGGGLLWYFKRRRLL
jgi:magnesium/cobalt transport protein CorA